MTASDTTEHPNSRARPRLPLRVSFPTASPTIRFPAGRDNANERPGRLGVANTGAVHIYCGARFPRSIRRGGMALRRSARECLTTVACFGLLAFALTACSTFSGAAVPVDSAIVVGPPATIEAALPPDGEIGAGPTATMPDASLALVASASTASDASA